MQITIDVPDAKFQTGDVVRRPNESNDACTYLHIIDRIAYGTWNHSSRAYMTVEQDTYTVAVLAGSVYDNAELSPMRPGITIRCDREALEAIAEKIEWSGEKLQPDDVDNIASRLTAWNQQRQSPQHISKQCEPTNKHEHQSQAVETDRANPDEPAAGG